MVKNTATASFACCSLCLCVTQFKKYFLALQVKLQLTGATKAKSLPCQFWYKSIFLKNEFLVFFFFFLFNAIYIPYYSVLFSLYIYFCR